MKNTWLADVNAALVAVLVGLLCTAAFFYVFPSRHLLRGVTELGVIAVAVRCGVLVWRRRRR